jgi:hypothetical protein
MITQKKLEKNEKEGKGNCGKDLEGGQGST